MILKAKIKCQNGLFFAIFSNRIYNEYNAYILNIPKNFKNEFNKEFEFKVVSYIRPSKGYLNAHIKRCEDIFNLIGTNGDTTQEKELLKYDYIPNLVELIN